MLLVGFLRRIAKLAFFDNNAKLMQQYVYGCRYLWLSLHDHIYPFRQ